MQRIDVVLNDPKGLHARVSSFLVQLGNQYKDTTLFLKSAGMSDPLPVVSSIMRLMTTPAKPYSLCRFFAEGPHAKNMFDELLHFSLSDPNNPNIKRPVFVNAEEAVQNNVKSAADAFAQAVENLPSQRHDSPCQAYQHVKTQIETQLDLRGRMSFIDLNATPPKAAINAIAQKINQNKEELACFIDPASRAIIMGNQAGVRHGNLASIIARDFGGNISNAPLTLTEALLQRNRLELIGLTIYFARDLAKTPNVENGIAAMFGDCADKPYHAGPYAYINLFPGQMRSLVGGGLSAYGLGMNCHPGRIV
ncbi:MAG: HPr family phosphocarrier protein [bacterium]